jgi:hypothetical protein
MISVVPEVDVLVENANNTDVASWQIDLVYTPSGSGVPIAVPLAFNNNDNTPTASITPGIDPGPYRVVLKVWNVINRPGIPTDTDIRVFSIPGPHGFHRPPYQKDPDPKPTLASGEPDAKPNEMNLGGQEFGWEGRGQPGFFHDVLQQVDASTFDMLPDPVLPTDGGKSIKLRRTSLSFNSPRSTLFDGSRILVASSAWGGPIDLPGGQTLRGLPRISRIHATLGTFIDEATPPGVAAIFGMVSSGSQLWGVGANAFLEGVLFEIVSSGSLSFNGPYMIDAVSPLTSIDFDGTNLWVTGPNGVLYKILPSLPAVPVGSVVTGGDTVRADPNGANYGDSNPRVYTVNSSGTIPITRVTTVGAPIVDATATTPVQPAARVAVGGGFIWHAYPSVAIEPLALILERLNPDPFTVDTATYTGMFMSNQVNSITYDPVTLGGRLWLTGESGDHNIVVARVNPTTLAVETTVILPTQNRNNSYGCNSDPVFIWQTTPCLTPSALWVPDPRVTSVTTGYGIIGLVSTSTDILGDLYKLDTLTLEHTTLPEVEYEAVYESFPKDSSTKANTKLVTIEGDHPVTAFPSPIVVQTDGIHAWVLGFGGSQFLAGVPGINLITPTITRYTLDPIPQPVDRFPIGSSEELVWDIFFDGSNMWGIRQEMAGSNDSFLIQITPDGRVTPNSFLLLSGDSPTQGVHFGGFLWLVHSVGVLRVDLAIPEGPNTNIPVTGSAFLESIALDPDGSNYPDLIPRLWVGESDSSGTFTVHRIHPVSLTVDASLSLGVGAEVYGLTAGGGFIWAVGHQAPPGEPMLWRITPNPVAISGSTSLGAAGNGYSVVYDADTAMVFTHQSLQNAAATETFSNGFRVSKYIPATLALDDTVQLQNVGGLDGQDISPGSSLPQGRLTMVGPGPKPLWLANYSYSGLPGTFLPGGLPYRLFGSLMNLPNMAPLSGLVEQPSPLRNQIWKQLLEDLSGRAMAPILGFPSDDGLFLRYTGDSTPQWQITDFRGGVQEITGSGTSATWNGRADVVLVDTNISAKTLDLVLTVEGIPKRVTIVDRFGDAAVRNISVRPPSGATIVSPFGTFTFGSPLVINQSWSYVTLVQTSTGTGVWHLIDQGVAGATFTHALITTTPFTITTQDAIGVNRTAASTVNLPTTLTSQKIIRVYDFSGNVANIITISPGGGFNIDGQTNYILASPFSAVELLWTNSSSRWTVINEYKQPHIQTTAAATTTLTTKNTIVLVDSLVGARTVNLPASPRLYEMHIIKDRDNNAALNNITVGRNGNFIDGLAVNASINTNGGALVLVWTNTASSSFGWRIV